MIPVTSKKSGEMLRDNAERRYQEKRRQKVADESVANETNVEFKGDRGFMLSLDNGKYVIFYNWSKEGQFKCQRYGQNWRDLLGDKMVTELCQLVINQPVSNTMDNTLREMFESEMSSVEEEYPELSHGALTMTAAERVIERLQEIVFSIADKRKWGHIDAVNKAHYDRPGYHGG